jgi:phospholipase/carboxylesterase
MADRTEAELTPAGRTTPVFLGHGRQDPMVAISLGTRTRAALEGWQVPVTWRDYPMPHSVCAEEIRDLGDWMTLRFSGG